MSNYVRPASLEEFAEARGRFPAWEIIAGGTDIEVPINLGHRRVDAVISPRSCGDLIGVHDSGDGLRIRPMTTFGTLEETVRERLPALAAASATVGSPQLRAMATIGGNLGTASPAGDSAPVLVACRAKIGLLSAGHAEREVDIDDFFVGPGRTTRAADEVISGVWVPFNAEERRSQRFVKIGARQSMVIAVVSVAVDINWTTHTVGIGIGSAGPTPLRAAQAESFLVENLWRGDDGHLIDPTDIEDMLTEVQRLVSLATCPISDQRGTARYRRHVAGEVAARCIRSMLNESMTRRNPQDD